MTIIFIPIISEKKIYRPTKWLQSGLFESQSVSAINFLNSCRFQTVAQLDDGSSKALKSAAKQLGSLQASKDGCKHDVIEDI